MTAQQQMTTVPSAAPGMPRSVATRRRVAAIAAAVAVTLAGYGGVRAVTSASNEVTVPAATAQDAAATTDHVRSGPDHLVRPHVGPDHLEWSAEGPDHLR